MTTFLVPHHIHDQMLPFWYAHASEDKQDKEELVKMEDMSICVSDISADGYFTRVSFVNIWVNENI